MRRVVLFSIAASLLSLTIAPTIHAQNAAPVASVEDRRDQLNALFAQYWDANLEHDPEFASGIGDTRFNAKINDYSVKAQNAWLQREQDFLTQLTAIDPTGLTDAEKTSREMLKRKFVEDIEAANFKEWEMPIDQLGGIYTNYPQLAAILSFATIKDYDDWIARLHAIPIAFAQVTENMTQGINDQRIPPKFLLEKALDQVKQLANQKPEDSPLAAPLKKFPASVSALEQKRIKDEMLKAIATEVLPAYQRFAHFLQVSYIPAGRTDPGIWAIPDGTQYYQFLIRRTTTTNLTAEQIHEIGVNEVKRNEADMLAIAQKLGFKDLQSFKTNLMTNPKLKPASADALLDAYKNYLTPMQAKLSQLFTRLPKAPFEVKPMPDYLAKTGPDAIYELGTPDGSRPGRLRINTYNATERYLYNVESIAYHEGIPGHHLQISIGQEQESLPTFRRFSNYTAFIEGWALYAEQLGKDVGFYQDPYSDYGRLENDMWRAIRLVVDTGVHAKHWTRDQMVQYFRDHWIIDETNIQTEVDRYISWPSQALAYKIGQLKILELRDKAKRELGDKFDLKTFHDLVIDASAMPLDMLEERINNWIASNKT
ncbi:MAG: DUF885 domain-containing protein [Gammaproteobacteria bacterium]